MRLTDDPGADTQPVLADTPYARTRVLFTTTRYDPAGSLATFALPDAWGWGYSVVSEVVEVGADLPGPVVGEASVRQVELDGGGVGLLVAFTARDGGTGLPALWVAFVRVWVEQVDDDGDGYPDREVHGTGLAGVWRVPADGGASHPDWVTVTEPAPDGEPGPSPEPSPTAGPGPGGAVLRFTQRTGHRAVADAVVGGDGTVRRLGGAGRTDDSGPDPVGGAREEVLQLRLERRPDELVRVVDHDQERAGPGAREVGDVAEVRGAPPAGRRRDGAPHADLDRPVRVALGPDPDHVAPVVARLAPGELREQRRLAVPLGSHDERAGRGAERTDEARALHAPHPGHGGVGGRDLVVGAHRAREPLCSEGVVRA